MTKPLSNSQIAKLGDRLRDGVYTAEDLALLWEYRASFAPALAEVVAGIATFTSTTPIERSANEPTERAAKSIQSIIYKLQRLSTTQLDRMQDIAGCRLVVSNLIEQDNDVEQLVGLFPDSRVDDLREKPHSGYRAVHVVVRTLNRRVEVQVRTELQDSWAQCSEHWAFKVDRAIKYGGGPVKAGKMLALLSDRVRKHEEQFISRVRSEPNFLGNDLSQAWVEFIANDAGLKAWLLQWKHEADNYRPPGGS
jgi:ppGpp synthetase/RelA/SpoT-type nucleotidyltranferase